MKFNSYILELRYTVIYSFICILFSSMICYLNKEKLIVLIADNLLLLKYSFIYTNFTEAILSYISISIIFGIYISLPILVLNIYLFLLPAVYQKELVKIKRIINIGVFTYIFSILTYKIFIIPNIFMFFLSFESADLLTFLPKFQDFVYFVVELFLYFSLCLSIPIFFFILEILLNISFYSYISSSRGFIIFFILVFSAIFAAADIISLFLFSLPIIIFFEISFFLLSVIHYLRITKEGS